MTTYKVPHYPKESPKESPNLLMVTWPYLAKFLTNSHQFCFKWYTNDIASSRRSSMKSRNLSWRNWPYLAHFLTNSCHFGYKWPPKVTQLSLTVPKEITKPLNVTWPYLPFTDSHHFRFKWYFYDTASSQMDFNEITSSLMKKLATSSQFLI